VKARVAGKVLWVLAGAAATGATGWLGLYGFAWNDYDNEARPAVEALVHGHLVTFLKIAPIYGGSLLERAPFALLTGLWGGGPLAVYRMLALPCLLAAMVLGLWLVARMRTRSSGGLACAVALGICVANPLTLAALEVGHPEELFGGALCIGAVLLAVRERPLWAALLLGLAIANKEWALLAVGPVLLALPARRILCLTLAAALSILIVVPFMLVGASVFTAGLHGAVSSSSEIFQPWQIWWFLGHHGPVVRGLFGVVKPGYRTAPAWIGAISHPSVLATGALFSAVLWWARRAPLAPTGLPRWLSRRALSVASSHTGQRRALSAAPTHADRLRAPKPRAISESDALLLLALVLLARCMLDTWDNGYYPLPFVLALLCWESLSFRRVPILSLLSVVAVWAGCTWMPTFASADAQAAFFLAWTLPLAVSLSVALYSSRPVSVDERQLLGKLREPLRALAVD
jgi:hypothetical protein